MKTRLLSLIALSFATVSCHKEKIGHPDPPVTGVAQVKLRDVVIRNLPSPYYHFEYNSDSMATKVDFASGFSIYDVVYNGSKIK